ncbi:MAG: hypothetical protein II411_06275 [Lachnospiraceae bacterium]|nr:hypothetical protein [Lachnospiraceae bacterium]
MKELTKKVLVMIAVVILLGIIAAIPGFAETQEELKQIFVTRQEVDIWLNGSGAQTGIRSVLESLEMKMQETVQSKVKIEMSIRGIKDKADES